MGETNYGSQTLSFAYGNAGTSESFNLLGFKLFPTGIYSGGGMWKVDDNNFAVDPFTVYVQDKTLDIVVRIETENAIQVAKDTTKPYLIGRMEWANQIVNYLDIIVAAESEILATDIIFGRVTYNDSDEVTGDFDYGERTEGSILGFGNIIFPDSNGEDPGPENWLIELDTPDCPMSTGHLPLSGHEVVYDYAKWVVDTKEMIDNPFAKWADKSVLGFFEATTNLLDDPEDLSTGNWTKDSGATAVLTDNQINGMRFTRLTRTNTTGWRRVYQTQTVTQASPSFSAIFKKGTARTTVIQVDSDASGIDIDWVNHTVAARGSGADNIRYHWINYDEYLYVTFACDTVTVGAVQINILPDEATPYEAGRYVDVTAVMFEDDTFCRAYTPSTRVESELQYDFIWPQNGSIECWVYPFFTVPGQEKFVFTDWTGGTYRIYLYLNSAGTDWIFEIYDGSNSNYLTRPFVGDKWTHLKASWDTVADSYKLIVDSVAATGAVALGTIPFDNHLSVGCAAGHSSPSGYQFDGLITDFRITNEADETTTHYTADKPYVSKNRVLGRNSSWRIDRFGNAFFKQMTEL